MVNFDRSEGFNKRYCSKECREKVTVRRCKPQCDLNNFETLKVKFIDGTEHLKRICKTCRNGNFVPNLENLPLNKKPNTVSVGLVKEKPKTKKYYNPIYKNEKWLKLRYEVFKKYGAKCMLCGSIERLHVDHIKPKSIHPELSLDFNNLQILCYHCNFGKSNTDETDFRPK